MSTVNLGSYYNSDTSSYKIFLDENKKFNVITLGIGSYGESFIETSDDDNFIHVLIGRYSVIGKQTTFLSTNNRTNNRVANYPFKNLSSQTNTHRQIIIGNDVRIGNNCTIFSGVQIGNGAIIDDNSVVRENVPPYAVISGNPAKIVAYRFTADIIDKLQKIKWWYWDKTLIEERLPLMEDAPKFAAQFDVSTLPLANVKELADMKRNGLKIYFIAADVGTASPVWDNVVTQYVGGYSTIGKSCLIVGFFSDDEKVAISARISSLCSDAGLTQVNILLVSCANNTYTEILPNVDAFISTREEISAVCIDYATDYGKKIISGLDEKIFQPPKSISIHENSPLLTIGIPTYNRSNCLRQLLNLLCPVVGNDPRVEIYISDNDSPDDTKDVAKSYVEMYENVRYHKNDENIGGDRNIFQVYKKARGKFVIAHGDDDGIVSAVWTKVLNIITQDESCGVISLLSKDGDYKITHGTTIAEYIRAMSYWTTWITMVILNRVAIDEIEQPDKCVDMTFNHLYLQMEILKRHKSFYIVEGSVLQAGLANEGPSGYNYMEAFIGNYFDILNDYADLSKEDMANEKLKILQEHILKYFQLSKAGVVSLSVDNAEKIFAKYYKDEPYYKQAVEVLMKIDAGTAGSRWSKYL